MSKKEENKQNVRLDRENIKSFRVIKTINDDFGTYDDVVEHLLEIHRNNCKDCRILLEQLKLNNKNQKRLEDFA